MVSTIHTSLLVWFSAIYNPLYILIRILCKIIVLVCLFCSHQVKNSIFLISQGWFASKLIQQKGKGVLQARTLIAARISNISCEIRRCRFLSYSFCDIIPVEPVPKYGKYRIFGETSGVFGETKEWLGETRSWFLGNICPDFGFLFCIWNMQNIHKKLRASTCFPDTCPLYS